MGKRAIITVDLVDESLMNPNGVIAEEILDWLRGEAVPAPWIKEIRKIDVQEF
jgi:hypothetical protein